MSAPVFLADPGHLDAAGSTCVLEGAEARHAGLVQRRATGERVDVVDGAGVRLRCHVARFETGRLTLDVLERLVEPPPPVRLVLVQALAKGDRDELAIEAATEVGVDAVIPWQAARSVVVWRGERSARSRARWCATVRQATKQARRAWVPAVEEAVDGRALAERAAAVRTAGGLVLVLHEEAERPLAGVPLPAARADAEPRPAARADAGVAEPRPAERPVDDAPEVLVVVGPEGGISEDEVARLEAVGAVAVRLGPHVLRTSTAGPIALALLAERLGRWG